MTPCSRVRVREACPGEVCDTGAAWRDPAILERTDSKGSPRAVAGMVWRRPEPLCAKDGGAERGELPKPFGAQNIASVSQMEDIELQDLIYTLGFGFHLVCL